MPAVTARAEGTAEIHVGPPEYKAGVSIGVHIPKRRSAEVMVI